LKQRAYSLDQRDIDIFFSPIRSKQDVVVLLMKCVKFMLLDSPKKPEVAVGKMILVVSKMSRLFFFSNDKYFSVNFPFTVTEEPNGLVFSSKLLVEIDHKITSDVLKVISSEEFNHSCIYTFNDCVAEFEEQTTGFWSLLKELLVFEDGYLRYDYDPVRVNGKKHPLHHIDVFYSNGSTFKIGTNKQIEHNSLVDLVDVLSDCHFLDTA